MTQSGQGDEPRLPSVRQPHEGIVLPADGGEPLMPGTTGEHAAPAGGAPWGSPWGPQSAPPPGAPTMPQTAAPGHAWGDSVGAAPGQHWGDGTGAPGPTQTGAVAQDGAVAHSVAWNASSSPQQGLAGGGALPEQTPVVGALPAAGDADPTQLIPPTAAGPSDPAALGAYGGQQVPPAYGGGQEVPPAYGGGLPGHGGAQHGAATPFAPIDEGVTQYIPPVAAGAPVGPDPSMGPNPLVGPGPASGGSGPSVGPGVLPPEVSSDATAYLGRVPGPASAGPLHAAASGGGAGAAAGAGPGAAVHPDAEATQYIAPVTAPPTRAPYGIRPGTPGDRQPPAEFDSLFRTEPEAGVASTQQLPQFDAQAPGPYASGHGDDAPDDFGSHRGAGRSRGRSGSKVPLIAAIGVGIAVIGIGAGALLGGGHDDAKDDSRPVSATAPTGGETSASPSADPAKQQAVALDKLLADSNDSRAAVIKAVANINRCTDLDQAAADLRDAAKQRKGLVTRLASLPVDRLPQHAQLTSALNTAWRASAAADTHYAAWADQVDGRKGCKKGHARTTGQTQAGNRSSGEATVAKRKASGLWNTIARQHGLTTRDPSQL